MINLGFDFERRIEEMVRNRINANSIKPLTLGGVAGPSGGVGSPIGSFIGQLSQVYITYDTTEAAIDTPNPLPSGISLVTNLNKIRFDIADLDSRVTVVESGGGGSPSFLTLTDTPSDYTGNYGKVVAVNSTEDGLVFITNSGGGATDFRTLTDTPSSFVSHGSEFVIVNSAETALEFLDYSPNDTDAVHVNVASEIFGITEKTTIHDDDLLIIEDSENSYNKKKIKKSLITASGVGGATNFTDLADVPQDYTNNGGYLLAVASGEDGVEFIDPSGLAGSQYFVDLLDTPADYTGFGGHLLAVASGEGGIEFISQSSNTDSDAIHDNVSGEINAITEKTTTVDNDIIIIEDSEASYAKKKVKKSNFSVAGTDENAIHDNVAGEIQAITIKNTLLNAGDRLLIEDYEDGYNKKKITRDSLYPTYFWRMLDGPGYYTGHAGEVAIVNATEDGLEYATMTGGSGGASNFIELADVPQAYTSQAGKVLAVKQTEDGLEFVTASGTGSVTDFTDLGDVPTSYTSQAGKILVVNTGETGLEFTSPSSGGSSASIIASLTTDVVLINDNTDTVMFTGTIPANTLVEDSQIAFNFGGVYFNNSVSSTYFILSIKLGSTVIYKDQTISIGSSATLKRPVFGGGIIGGNGGTSAQTLNGFVLVGTGTSTVGFGDMGTDEINATTPFQGTSTEDATTELAFEIKIQLSTVHASHSFTLNNAILYLAGVGGSAGGGDVSADTLWDAKGDIAVATGSDTATRLGVGTNGQILVADSAETTGIKWATPEASVSDLGDLGDVVITDPTNNDQLIYSNGTWINVETISGGLSEGVGTDVIWDSKGDLAVGTGANTALKLAVGVSGQVLTADSSETTGVKWADPAGGAIGFTPITTSGPGTYTWNLANGSTEIDIDGNTVISASNLTSVEGFVVFMKLSKNSADYTVSFNTDNFWFTGGVQPALSTGSGILDVLSFACDGTYLYNLNVVKNLLDEFYPSGISNLAVWLDADDISGSENDPISTWADKSGNNNDFSSQDNARRPLLKLNSINGHKSLLFDNTDDSLVSAYEIDGQPYTVFIVAKAYDTTGGYHKILTQGGWWDFGHMSGDKIYMYNYGEYQGPSGSANGTFVISHHQNYVGEGTCVGELRVNGDIIVSSSTLAWPTEPLMVGKYDGDQCNSYVAEILIYEKDLSSVERESVETYLMIKYGVT